MQNNSNSIILESSKLRIRDHKKKKKKKKKDNNTKLIWQSAHWFLTIFFLFTENLINSMTMHAPYRKHWWNCRRVHKLGEEKGVLERSSRVRQPSSWCPTSEGHWYLFAQHLQQIIGANACDLFVELVVCSVRIICYASYNITPYTLTSHTLSLSCNPSRTLLHTLQMPLASLWFTLLAQVCISGDTTWDVTTA